MRRRSVSLRSSITPVDKARGDIRLPPLAPTLLPVPAPPSINDADENVADADVLLIAPPPPCETSELSKYTRPEFSICSIGGAYDKRMKNVNTNVRENTSHCTLITGSEGWATSKRVWTAGQ